MAGVHYVLDRQSGRVVREVECHEPIFSSPITNGDRVYVATVGAQIYALTSDGQTVWTWDFVKEVIGFQGDRWKGEDWLQARPNRVTWRDHFVCSRELCLLDKKVLVVPAGGRTVFLEDAGDKAALRVAGEIPQYDGNEYPATFGQSADAAGNVYVQWHRRDNAGRVEVLKLSGDKVETSFVSGTQTAIQLPGLLSFAGVSVRGSDVYRVRPEQGMGLCKHRLGTEDTPPEVLCPAPSICSPVLTQEHAVYGGLDGQLYIVPLSGGQSQKLGTAFGCPITAPVAVADQRIVVASEDGHVYVFGPGGQAALPNVDLKLTKIRSPLSGALADAKYDWYTNYGDFSSTNSNDQQLQPPLRMRWCEDWKARSSTCRFVVVADCIRIPPRAW